MKGGSERRRRYEDHDPTRWMKGRGGKHHSGVKLETMKIRVIINSHSVVAI